MADKNEFERAARLLSTDQQHEAIRNLVGLANEPEAGIMRQLLAEPDKPLTDKQKYVFDNHILPSLVERCGNHTCSGFSLSGVEYCDACAIRLG